MSPSATTCARTQGAADEREDQVDPEIPEVGADDRGGEAPAGFTDEPLIGMIATWIASSVSGIARSAVPVHVAVRRLEDHRDEECGHHRLDHDACPVVRAWVVVAATASSLNAIRTTREAAIAPTTCETQ